MTEKLPLESWSKETESIIDLYHSELINESHIIGLREEDEPFVFTEYEWYLVPMEYNEILRIYESGIYEERYIVLQYGEIYWIANRKIQ